MPPVLKVSEDVTFQMQSGLIRDTVTVDVNELNLNSLKSLACNFIDKKVKFLFNKPLSLNFFLLLF